MLIANTKLVVFTTLLIGIKNNFEYHLKDFYWVLGICIIFSLLAFNTYKMTIEDNRFQIFKLIGKNLSIDLEKIYKIEVENLSWQMERHYKVFIYTEVQIFETSPSAFNIKELDSYLSTLCSERGLLYSLNCKKRG